MRVFSLLAVFLVLLATSCRPPHEARPAAAPDPEAHVAALGPADPADWCSEHGVPESRCTKCNPDLVAKFQAAGDWCAAHGFPESVCPTCNPMKPPEGAPSTIKRAGLAAGGTVRFESAEVAAAAGVHVVPAVASDLATEVECAVVIDHDRTRTSELRAPADATVKELRVEVGDEVRAGDVLLVLAAREAGDATARLAAARERVTTAEAELERQQALVTDGIAPRRDVDLARQEAAAARAELAAAKSAVAATGAEGGSAIVRAPRAGIVVERQVSAGSGVEIGDPLVVVADPSRAWAMVALPVAEAPFVDTGAAVEIEIDGLPGELLHGEVSWLSRLVDSATRTVPLRVELDNSDGSLRAGARGRARVALGGSEGGVLVPVDCVQRAGDDAVVFVEAGPGAYAARPVQLGRVHQGLVQVLSGVEAGEPVVVSGAFLLKSELSKDALGAGCCDVEKPGGGE